MKVLLTNYRMYLFSGSEMVTLELYDYFDKQGHEVEIFANVVSKDMEAYLLEKNVSFSTPSSFILSDTYDLLWVHQQTIPIKFFEKNPSIGAIIFNHMSPFLDLESSLNSEIENALSEKILTNSEETAQKIKSLGINDSKVVVFENPVPEIFFNFPSDQRSNTYFLFISNHPPEEVLEAMEILSEMGETFIHIGKGSKWAISKRISPREIAGASVVISIGKSVQYAIAMRKAFYIYDINGGDGFIKSVENFKENALYNFSGRNSRQSKSAPDIVSELLLYKSNNAHELGVIRSEDLERYNLDVRIGELLRSIDFTKKFFFLDRITSQQAATLRGTIGIISELLMRWESSVIDYQELVNSRRWKLTSIFAKLVDYLKIN